MADVERKWMPHDYEDEAVPPARATPSDWIMKTPEGCALIGLEDWSFGEEYPHRPLADGDIVEFDWTETYGRRTIVFECVDDESEEEVARNGWHMTGDAPVASPGAALSLCEIGNPESIAPSLEEFCDNYLPGEPGRTGDVTVVFYGWSRKPVKFQFRDGAFHSARYAIHTGFPCVAANQVDEAFTQDEALDKVKALLEGKTVNYACSVDMRPKEPPIETAAEREALAELVKSVGRVKTHG